MSELFIEYYIPFKVTIIAVIDWGEKNAAEGSPVSDWFLEGNQ